MKNVLLTILLCGLMSGVMYAQAPQQTPITRADSLAGFNSDSVRAVAVTAGIEAWEVEVHVQACERRYLNQKYGLNQRNGNNVTVPMTPCTNMGFETGDFTGWTGYIGDNTVSSLGPLQNITPGIFTGALNPLESDMNARHSIMSAAAPNDACGGFAMVPSGYGTYVCRIGNTYAQYQGEGLEQTFVVDPQNTQFTYRYAVVLYDGTHPAAEQPYFSISVLDSVGTPVNACAQYYVAAGTSNVGFTSCGNQTWYRPWTTVSFDLSAFSGQSITIRFQAAGCIWSGHYAMAYIDASCSSIAEAVSATFCPGSPGAFLVAPPGFGDYQWFYPNGSPIPGATNDSLFVPSATTGDTFSVEMHAIADTSCVTVLNVVIELTLLQTQITSTDPICYGQSNGSATETCNNCLPPVSYTWNPSGQTSQTATGLPAGTYIVSITDSIGCQEQDTVTLVNPARLDTSGITYTFCYGDRDITLIALPGQPGYQWYDSNFDTIPGEINQTLYIAQPQLGALYYCVYNTSPCPTTDSIILNYIPPPDVFSPDSLVNVFTPNGDLKNDYFYPFYDYTIANQTAVAGTPQFDFYSLYVLNFEVWIYNRWGQEVYYSSNYDIGWDGKIDGKDGDVGVYYYITKYTNRCHPEEPPLTKTGFVHLQR